MDSQGWFVVIEEGVHYPEDGKTQVRAKKRASKRLAQFAMAEPRWLWHKSRVDRHKDALLDAGRGFDRLQVGLVIRLRAKCVTAFLLGHSMINDGPNTRSLCKNLGACNRNRTTLSSGSSSSGSWCPDAAASLWTRLTQRIGPMVRALVRCAQSSMEIVAEAATAAILRFSCATKWEDILSWGCKVARNLVIRFYRGRSRRRETSIENAREVDLISQSEGCCSFGMADYLQCLLPRLSPSARETLSLISAGTCSATEISAVRGVSARAVTKTIHGIRRAAAGIGNYS